MRKFIVRSTLFLIAIGCKQNSQDHSNHVITGESLNSTSSGSEQRDSSNSDDRTIWQRPNKILEMLGPLDHKVVADIGAGSGYFSFKFVHTAKKVIAIDIEQELIDLMNEEKQYYQKEIKDKIEARLAKPNDPQLLDQEADIIFLSNTYCYLQNRLSYLKNLKPKLREGGKIMIVDFKKKMMPIGPEMNSRIAQGDVEKELEDAGYVIEISDDTTLKYQYIIVAVLK